MSGNRCANEPVISMMSTVPVIGDFTTQAKYAAMPNTMQSTASCGASRPSSTAAFAKTAPPSAPSTSIGRKMPPGTPEPKQSIVKKNFPRKSTRRKHRP